MGKKHNEQIKETKHKENTGEQEAIQAEDPSASTSEGPVTLSADEFNQVKARIEELTREKDEAINLAQRVQADFDNYRRRNATLKKDSYDEGIRDCMRAMLPSLDNLDRALDNTDGVSEAYIGGIRLVQRTLFQSLEKLGLSEIETDGGFDANLHDAVMQEAAEGKAPGEIIEVFQKGYRADGKILRHSMVKVAQ